MSMIRTLCLMITSLVTVASLSAFETISVPAAEQIAAQVRAEAEAGKSYAITVTLRDGTKVKALADWEAGVLVVRPVSGEAFQSISVAFADDGESVVGIVAIAPDSQRIEVVVHGDQVTEVQVAAEGGETTGTYSVGNGNAGGYSKADGDGIGNAGGTGTAGVPVHTTAVMYERPVSDTGE